MNIDLIMLKSQSGEILCASEIEALMLHAIDLLTFIKQETLTSIDNANNLLAAEYAIAA